MDSNFSNYTPYIMIFVSLVQIEERVKDRYMDLTLQVLLIAKHFAVGAKKTQSSFFLFGPQSSNGQESNWLHIY